MMSASSSHSPKEFRRNFAHQFKDRNLKVALVCDWLTVVRGAEQVLREIHHLFPHAPIYTSQYGLKMPKLKLVG